MFIDQQSTSCCCDRLHRQVQLFAAVTTQRSQHLAREALRVDAHQRSSVLRQVAKNDRQRGFAQVFILEAYRLTHSPPRRYLRRGYFSERPCWCAAVHRWTYGLMTALLPLLS